MVCADVGAHIGYMTVLMAKKVGHAGSVYSVEPSTRNLAQLRKNLRLNGAENVQVVEAAATNADGTAYLVDGEASAMNRLGPEGTSVRTIRLESLLAQTEIGFIKLDVEGADREAVEGMGTLLTVQRPVILIEGHDEPTVLALDHLRSLNYRVRPIGGGRHFLCASTGRMTT